jgi:hypothetical protein
VTPAEIKRDGAMGVKCQLCLAPVGEPCKAVDEVTISTPHATRIHAAQRAAHWGVYQGPECRAEHARERAEADALTYPKLSSDTITVIACSSTKRGERCEAAELYSASQLFKLSRAYAESFIGTPWFIVSAKHALVHPKCQLAPYDLSMSKLTKRERQMWGSRTCAEIEALTLWKPGTRTIVVLAGEDYARELRVGLMHKSTRYEFNEPLAGLQIGQRLRWLKEQL